MGIVLGAAVRPDGSASATLELRVRHAVGLLRSDRLDLLCLTGGIGAHGDAEAKIAASLARSLGVADTVLLVEATSTNTFGNIALALPLLPPEAVLTLVSSRWHLPRAWLTARLMGRRAELSGPSGTMGRTRTMTAILREVVATPLSVLRAVRWRRRRR